MCRDLDLRDARVRSRRAEHGSGAARPISSAALLKPLMML
jgi:hypothetical protein